MFPLYWTNDKIHAFPSDQTPHTHTQKKTKSYVVAKVKCINSYQHSEWCLDIHNKRQQTVYKGTGTCTCDHNGVTGSTRQQLHSAQPNHRELRHMGLLWTDVSWSAMSSLSKLPITPAKQIHMGLTLYVLGTQTEKRDVF